MANARFSKVNVGRINKRGRFDLSHGVSTTYDFGSCQPIFSKLMIPNSSIKGSINGAVRCMPMPLPPFGKCGLHFYGQFVKFSDLLRNFGAFVARQTFTSAHASYVPQKLPSLPINGPVSLVSLLLTPRFSVWCPFKVASISDISTEKNLSGTLAGTAFTFEADVDASNFKSLEPYVIPTSGISTEQFNTYYGYVKANSTTRSLSASWMNGFSDSNRILANQVSTFNDYDTVIKCGYSISNADYFFVAPANDIATSTTTYYSQPTAIAVWLTDEGRRLVKILNGLGIEVSLTDSSVVSLMPLFAYYKAWFDIFAPKRDLLWTDTRAAKLLDWADEYGEDFQDIGVDTSLAEQGVTVSHLCEFLYDITQTFATCEPNYFTSAINSANQQKTYPQMDSPELDTSVVSSKQNTNGGLATLSKGYLTNVSLEVVNKLARYINTNNVIGKNIDAFFKAHFDGYAGTEKNSSFAGSSVLDIELGDVIVTADTDIADAGEFAGVGFGRGDFDIKYSTKEFGIYIVLSAVVPRTNYVQGSDYDVFITKPLELPTPELDALGFDKVRISELYGCGVKDTHGTAIFGNNAFGYQPRYTGHKVMNSKLMGDFKFNGTRDNYIGMTLDNFITQNEIRYAKGTVNSKAATLTNTVRILSAPASRFVASPNWRYTGKDKLLSNFDRIFKSSGTAVNSARVPLTNDTVSNNEWEKLGKLPTFDNFVAHFEADLRYNAPLNNISSSYFTLEGADNFVEHE